MVDQETSQAPLRLRDPESLEVHQIQRLEVHRLFPRHPEFCMEKLNLFPRFLRVLYSLTPEFPGDPAVAATERSSGRALRGDFLGK